MNERNHNKNRFHAVGRTSGERGVSLVEMLIVVAMIGVVTSFAVMQIAGAQRAIRLTNSAREFASWLDKTRLDSIRRHATTPAIAGEADLRARVTIATANSYTVQIDQDGDGVLDPARTFSIPATHGATFAGITVPTTIYYDWRGRSVNATGALLGLSFRLEDGSGNSNPITLTSAGDTSHSNVNAATVSVVGGNSTTANIKAKTTVP